MRGNRIVLFLTLTSVLLAPNCATITIKSTQRIPVTSTPVGATVIVNGVRQGVTPLEIRLERKQKGQVIRIESPGYNPVEIRLERKMSASLFFDSIYALALGSVAAVWWGEAHEDSRHYYVGIAVTWALTTAAFSTVFTAIDTGGTGKGYELRPDALTVTLKKVNGPPRVDTMVIDADRFGDIKWIRVRRD
jgi:hypothetical protein